MDRRPPVSGNREKALLSHVFSYAIRWGVAKDNPCRHVKRNTERPSGKYVDPAQYRLVYDIMPELVQCAMDIALLAGLRQGDVLKLKRTDSKKDAERHIHGLDTAYRQGQPYTSDGLRTLWQKAILRAIREGRLDPTMQFAFKDLRTTAGSDASDNNLLGHDDRRILYRHHKRKPLKVTPLR
ncbi:MAG: hypothetical protein ACU4EQ_12750 [Candidatus Nitrosoglobus sp.]